MDSKLKQKERQEADRLYEENQAREAKKQAQQQASNDIFSNLTAYKPEWSHLFSSISCDCFGLVWLG